MSFFLDQGHTIVGIDQSQGLLARAYELFPAVQTEKLGLQEMSFQEGFDGAICVDAMEHVFPEDWPLILHNFHLALKPKGYFYFTVELAEARPQELPVVFGEWVNTDVYHYYPSMEQVREWLEQAGFV
jgi:cyclopropane fatty-acyl-phospholipid synthase-like methyltransferase